MARFMEDRSADTMFVNGSLDSLLPLESVARTIWGALSTLDFGRFEAVYRNDAMGRPAIAPMRLAAVWIVALLRGVTSSVELARRCAEDIELRWLLGDAPVEKSTLCAFRKDHMASLQDLSTQVLAALAQAKLLPGASVAVDGSVIRAAASCRSSISRKTLERRVERLRGVIEEKLNTPEEEGAEVLERKRRKARLEGALAQMRSLRAFKDTDRITVTEPDASRKRLKTGGFAPAHNVQVVTDADTGAIIHTGVVPNGNDKGQLLDQVNQAQAELERVQKRAGLDGAGPVQDVAADSAYHDTRQLVELIETRGMKAAVPAPAPYRQTGVSDAYLASNFTYDPETDTMTCPQGQSLRRRKHNRKKTAVTYNARADVCAACPHKQQCCPKAKHGRSVNRPLHTQTLSAVSQCVDSDYGKALLRARWITCEGAFARLTERLHWRRCRTWGATGARVEALWRQIAHNLMLVTGQWKPLLPQDA